MNWEKKALAIDAMAREELQELGLFTLFQDREKKGRFRKTETPDDAYYCYYWECESIDPVEWEDVCDWLKKRRHAMITVTEEGDLIKDVSVSDEFGCDEEFYEILGWKTELTLWQEVLV